MDELLTDIANKSGFSSFGFRVISENPVSGESAKYSEGDSLPNSFSWVDGEATDVELEGVSTIKAGWDGWEIEDADYSIEQLKPYLSLGTQIVFVGGSSGYEGNDVGEEVIGNAVVLHVIRG